MLSHETLTDACLLWDYHRIDDPLERADAIVGLGSYDLRVATYCADLYFQGLAPRIVFTGAEGNWTNALYNGSEARAFADHAIGEGVPEDVIALEEFARNIGENLALSRALVGAQARVILVTKPQTQRRVAATQPIQWPHAEAMVTAPLHDLDMQPTPNHPMPMLISEMVGDLFRIATYPALGFQEKQSIPGRVQDAYRRLVAAGYTQHIPEDGATLFA